MHVLHDRPAFRLPARALFLIGAVSTLLCACAVGPNYKRPAAPVTAKWELVEPWREGAPKDALPRGEWWTVFHDDDLNVFEKQALDANQTIKVAIARLEQARAAAAVQIAAGFSALPASAAGPRQRAFRKRPTEGGPHGPRAAP